MELRSLSPKLRTKTTVLSLFLANKTALNLFLGFNSLMCAFGSFLGVPGSSNYVIIKSFAPLWVWGLMFLAHALMCLGRAASLVPTWFNLLKAVLGLWLWSYILVSFVFLDTSPPAPFEFLLFAFVAAELWMLSCGMFIVTYKGAK